MKLSLQPTMMKTYAQQKMREGILLFAEQLVCCFNECTEQKSAFHANDISMFHSLKNIIDDDFVSASME